MTEAHSADVVVAVVQGDCSTTQGLMETLEDRGVPVIPFAFPYDADRDELLTWLTGLKTPPRNVFAVHGEPETVASFADFLKSKTGWPVSVPKYLDEVTLD